MRTQKGSLGFAWDIFDVVWASAVRENVDVEGGYKVWGGFRASERRKPRTRARSSWRAAVRVIRSGQKARQVYTYQLWSAQKRPAARRSGRKSQRLSANDMSAASAEAPDATQSRLPAASPPLLLKAPPPPRLVYLDDSLPYSLALVLPPQPASLPTLTPFAAPTCSALAAAASSLRAFDHRRGTCRRGIFFVSRRLACVARLSFELILPLPAAFRPPGLLTAPPMPTTPPSRRPPPLAAAVEGAAAPSRPSRRLARSLAVCIAAAAARLSPDSNANCAANSTVPRRCLPPPATIAERAAPACPVRVVVAVRPTRQLAVLFVSGLAGYTLATVLLPPASCTARMLTDASRRLST
ncbi:hypothetical protein FRC12_024521 [Ceratobasidium sp. 428]|nr:hypothetical protein FRC12_024521 [Ceratobasidium sp. 428]